MIRWEEWVDIVSLHRQGFSIRAISARLGIARNTVRAALRREGPPVRTPRTLPSKLDPYKDYLLARLADYPELSARTSADDRHTKHQQRACEQAKGVRGPERVVLLRRA